MRDWRLIPGNYTIGDLSSPIAVCQLGKSKIDLPERLYAIKGNLMTANVGIARLVKNVNRNPNLRFLAIVGDDVAGFLPGQALLALQEHGVDDDKHIIGAKGYDPELHSLSEQDIATFRNKFEIFDYRNEPEQEVREKLENIQPLQNPLPLKPVIQEIESETQLSPQQKQLKTETIIGETIATVWPKTLRKVRLYGTRQKVTIGEKAIPTREILGLAVQVDKPLKDRIPDGYHRTKEELDTYVEQSFLNPNPREGHYTYGSRMHNHGNLAGTIHYLKEYEDTRRAVVATWDPKQDVGNHSPPCLTLVQFFKRNGKLHSLSYWRSHDMYGAAPDNWYGLSALMKHVAAKLDCQVGKLMTISASAHIYEHDLKNVADVIGEYPKQLAAKYRAWNKDQKGYFIITLDRDAEIITVKHYNNHNDLLHILNGANPKQLARTIADHIPSLKPYHFLYLGRELEKAKRALKTGKEYIQE